MAIPAITPAITPVANNTSNSLVAAPTVQQSQSGILNAATLVNPATTAVPNQVQLDQQLGTVEGRTASILQADSPLMQRAAAKANIASNAKGTLNSSMAVGAAQNAVIEAAAPIAKADAAAFNQFDLSNQNAKNSMEQFNIANEQQTNISDANALNTINVKQASLDQQTNLYNMQQQNKVVFDQLDQNNKIELGNIQAAYKNEMQANVTTSKLFSDTMSALSLIQKDTNMNATTKQRNMDQMISMLKTGMNVAGSISNLNLGSLLDFSQLPAAV